MRTPILAIALMLAACNGATTGDTAAEPTAPSAFQNRVAALSDGERNLVLIRAIRDAGQECQGVTKSVRRDDAAGGQPLWVATCQGGASFGVVIGRDGTAQVVGAR